MTVISQAALWLGWPAKARIPRRPKARRRGWWFAVNIDEPTVVPLRQTRQLPGDLFAREHGHRSRAVGIGAVNQLCRLGQQSG
jgi:hypothetical protein